MGLGLGLVRARVGVTVGVGVKVRVRDGVRPRGLVTGQPSPLLPRGAGGEGVVGCVQPLEARLS